jgi:hypothetical protein
VCVVVLVVWCVVLDSSFVKIDSTLKYDHFVIIENVNDV